MSEDNKQLEEQLDNQAQTPKEPDSVILENLSNLNQPFNDSVSSTTETTSAEKADKTSVASELTGALSGPEDILAALAEQLGTSQQSEDLLGQLQLLIATLTQDNEALLQANESLKEQLEEQNGQIETTKRRYIGLAAEFDNFRKRTQREKEDQEKQAKRKTLNELLTVVDDFERARRLIQPANDGEMAIHKSYQGVYKKFVDSLKSLGVSAMRTEGQPFDPIYHEALLSEPTNEYPEGTILDELDRGYLLDDQVLRYAKVKVAAPKDPESSETEKTTEAISDA